MNRHTHIVLWLLFPVIFLGIGCDQLQPQPTASDIRGITLADLQPMQPEVVPESLLSFSVLTYTLDIEALESLEHVVDFLSQNRVRYDNIGAFGANGFSIGCGAHDEGAVIAQKLRTIGAVRISQNALMIPSSSEEILYSRTVASPCAVIFSTSATGAGGVSVTPGKLGWVISAQPDNSVENAVEIVLCPAFWRLGASDLRILSGQEPFQFQFFDVGRVRFPMEVGQFCLLGPMRAVKGEDTLDRFLFEVPGKEKIIFFVIVYRGPAAN